MVLFPREGRVYWYVTDFWETFYAIPVTMERGFVRWDLEDGFHEIYPASRWKLYKTQKQAKRAADKLNRKAIA